MTKELIAAALLVLLILGSWLNLLYLDALISDIEARLDLSMRSYWLGSGMQAHGELLDAFALWLHADSYTHVFIRHAEIDAASDAFYELQSAIFSHDADAAAAGCGKLLYHLRSMSSMEHVTVKSVF